MAKKKMERLYKTYEPDNCKLLYVIDNYEIWYMEYNNSKFIYIIYGESIMEWGWIINANFKINNIIYINFKIKYQHIMNMLEIYQ